MAALRPIMSVKGKGKGCEDANLTAIALMNAARASVLCGAVLSTRALPYADRLPRELE